MATSPPYQMSMFYNDDFGRGWSEKYFLTSALDLASLQNLVANLLSYRMPLSPASVKWQHARIQSTDPRYPFTVLPSSGAPVPGSFVDEQLPADVAVLVRLRSSTNRTNRIFLRGMPEAKTRGEQLVANGIWDPLFTSFIGYLVSASVFGVRSRKPGVVSTPVVSLAANTPKGIAMVVPAADPVLSIGNQVVLSKVPIPGYNGVKNVVGTFTPVGVGKGYILGGGNPISSPPTTGTYYYKLLQYDAPNVAGGVQEGVSNRKVGRPFGLSAGRARTTFSQRPSTLAV